jgi:hypothetical protein
MDIEARLRKLEFRYRAALSAASGRAHPWLLEAATYRNGS